MFGTLAFNKEHFNNSVIRYASHLELCRNIIFSQVTKQSSHVLAPLKQKLRIPIPIGSVSLNCVWVTGTLVLWNWRVFGTNIFLFYLLKLVILMFKVWKWLFLFSSYLNKWIIKTKANIQKTMCVQILVLHTVSFNL